MKKFRTFLLLIIMLPCVFLFGGCATDPYVIGIEKTDSIGNNDVYTIYYSDNTSSSLTIENGKDGQDAENITIDDIFMSLVERGEYSDTDEDYHRFLSDYLNLTLEENSTKTLW